MSAGRRPEQLELAMTPASRVIIDRIWALNRDLRSAASATLVLEDWCRSTRIGTQSVSAIQQGRCEPPSTKVLRALRLGFGERVERRRVTLASGRVDLSRANNWYVPGRLPEETQRCLRTGKVPFGRLIADLDPVRVTYSVAPTVGPAEVESGLEVGDVVLEHRAVILDRDYRPLCVVHEHYLAVLVLAQPKPLRRRQPREGVLAEGEGFEPSSR